MNQYSENELAFFKQLLLEYDVRVDGRKKMEKRKYKIEYDIINNCFSSLKLTYNNSKSEMIFAIKGELLKEEEQTEDSNYSDKIVVSINSMAYKTSQSEEYKTTKNKMEYLINNLIVSKISTDSLFIDGSSQKMSWKLYLDIFIFDELRMSLFQLISIGVKKILENVKVPKLKVFQNEIENNIEYDLKTNYEDIKYEDSEEKIKLDIPNVYSFAILNNFLYLDPSDEELMITSCSLYLNEKNKKILNVESIGDSVDPVLYSQLSNIINNLQEE